MQKNDKQGAMADYNHAIELDPKSSDPYECRGQIKRALHDEDGALADFNRGIELNPQGWSIYSNRAQV